MAEYLIQNSTLTGIADAIRAKTGSTEAISVIDMASEIGGISIPVEEEVVVEADFSTGDMIVEPEEDTAFSKVTIQKPDNLLPENIVKGVDIAGIIGEFEGSSGDLEDTLRYLKCQIDPVNRTITLYSIDYSLIYKDTGSYDVTIPDTLCGLQVVIST